MGFLGFVHLYKWFFFGPLLITGATSGRTSRFFKFSCQETWGVDAFKFNPSRPMLRVRIPENSDIQKKRFFGRQKDIMIV